MSQEFKYDVYLSYSSLDLAIVKGLAERLRNDGIQVWFDEWMIRGGDPILKQIDEGLTSSRTLVLVMSKHAFQSDWVTLELHTAMFRNPMNQGERRFIPLLISETPIPDTLKQYAYVDWRERSKEEYNHLLGQISAKGVPSPNPTSRDVEVKLSIAMSVDGFIDDAGPEKLVLSNSKDWDQVDIMREWCDAIMVGANALRKDNPRLLIRSEHRQRERQDKGRSTNPMKITLTKSGELSPASAFFQLGNERKLIYCPPQVGELLRASILELAEVRELEPITGKAILDDLACQGVRRLMIEGGTKVASLFLQEGLVDEMRLSIAPFFIAEDDAPRLVEAGAFPHGSGNAMTLKSVERIEGMAILHYDLKRTD